MGFRDVTATATAGFRDFTEGKNAARLLIFGFFFMVAAASFSGTMSKWAMNDGKPRFGIDLMLDGTAHKPFVYRQLDPLLARAATAIAPESLKALVVVKFRPEEHFANIGVRTTVDEQFRYFAMCMLEFASLLGSLIVLRTLLLELGYSAHAAIISPVALVLAIPYLQTGGGYYYDSTELFFLSVAVLLALRGSVFLLLLIAIPATLNKETFFFFIPTLYPLLRTRLTARSTLLVLGAGVAISGLINVAEKLYFLASQGGAAELQVSYNLYVYTTLKSYFRIENTYGVGGPAGANILTFFVMAIIAVRGWSRCNEGIKAHAKLAACINLVLFAIWAAGGELRNLSLLFVAFVVLIAGAVDNRSSQRTAMASGAN